MRQRFGASGIFQKKKNVQGKVNLKLCAGSKDKINGLELRKFPF